MKFFFSSDLVHRFTKYFSIPSSNSFEVGSSQNNHALFSLQGSYFGNSQFERVTLHIIPIHLKGVELQPIAQLASYRTLKMKLQFFLFFFKGNLTSLHFWNFYSLNRLNFMLCATFAQWMNTINSQELLYFLVDIMVYMTFNFRNISAKVCVIEWKQVKVHHFLHCSAIYCRVST